MKFRAWKCATCKQIGKPGYGRDSGGRKHCYACCAVRDKKQMLKTGRAVLYLTREQPDPEGAPVWYVTNWPGTLRLHAFVRKGAHNMARSRMDAWFTFEGAQWHGVNVGENEIIRCKRLKNR